MNHNGKDFHGPERLGVSARLRLLTACIRWAGRQKAAIAGAEAADGRGASS
jgi:hypothetical protein